VPLSGVQHVSSYNLQTCTVNLCISILVPTRVDTSYTIKACMLTVLSGSAYTADSAATLAHTHAITSCIQLRILVARHCVPPCRVQSPPVYQVGAPPYCRTGAPGGPGQRVLSRILDELEAYRAHREAGAPTASSCSHSQRRAATCQGTGATDTSGISTQQGTWAPINHIWSTARSHACTRASLSRVYTRREEKLPLAPDATGRLPLGSG